MASHTFLRRLPKWVNSEKLTRGRGLLLRLPGGLGCSQGRLLQRSLACRRPHGGTLLRLVLLQALLLLLQLRRVLLVLLLLLSNLHHVSS